MLEEEAELVEQKLFSQVEAEALARENKWLKMHLEWYEAEERQFGQEDSMYLCSGDLVSYVPPLPPRAIRSTVSSPSLAGYLLTADAYAILLNRLIPPHARVLDIGCGCGKHARSLIPHPLIASYVGFDPYRPSIEWCNDFLVPYGNGRFSFEFLDIYSKAYNLDGQIKGIDVVFPVGNASIDFAFASSVFTHLLHDDAIHYLNETRRCMDVGAVFLATIIETKEDGRDYHGDEILFQYRKEYFIECAERAGFRLMKHLGRMFEQDAFLFVPI